ncbi:syntaxin-12-like [Onthophagus taurus]|uniref:syntaxin-12-like n=1 Tax=Onthophagus taurus TaxID=166361 RepID=UPI0039BE31B4
MYKISRISSSFSRKGSEATIKQKEYENLTKAIGSGIRTITKNVASMKKMGNQIGTSKDTPKLVKQLNAIDLSTKELVTKTYNKMDELSGLVATYQSQKRQSKCDQLKYDLLAAMNNFEMIQENLTHTTKQYIKIIPSKGVKSQQRISHSTQVSTHHPHQQHEQVEQQIQEQERVQEAIDKQKAVNEALLERSRNLKLLTSRMTEMAGIYKDFQAKTAEQGEVITHIDKTIQEATGSVQRGTRDVRQANVYQKKYLKMKYILMIIGAVVLVVTVSIIIWLFA